MTRIGDIIIGFAVDVETLRRGMSEAENIALRSLERIGNVGQRLTTRLSAPLALVGGFAVKLASDAEEAAAKFSTVLGPLENDFGRFIADLQQSVPATTRELQGFIATTQDLLVPLGILPERAANLTQQVVRLATDLASFNNLRLEDVFRDLFSGLVGQFETLRKYGVALDANLVKQEAYRLGLAASTKEVDAAAKAQAAIALILERTQAAQGDAARTADSTANSFRFLRRELTELGTEFGATITPVITPLVQGVTLLVRAFREVPAPIKAAIVGLAGITAAVGPALIAFSKLRIAIGVIQGTGLAASLGTLGGLLAVGGPILAGLAAGAAALLFFRRATAQAREEVDRFDESLATSSGSQLEAHLERLKTKQEELIELRNIYLENRGNVEDPTAQALNTTRLNESQSALIRVGDAIAKVKERLEELKGAPPVTSGTEPEKLTDLERILKRHNDRIVEIAENVVALAGAYDAAGQELQALRDLFEDLRAAGVDVVGDLPEDLERARDRMKELTQEERLDALRNGIDLAGDALSRFDLNARELPKRFQRAMSTLSESTGPAADKLYALGDVLGNLDDQAAGFFSNLGAIVESIKTGGAVGIAGAIGIGVGLIKGLFGDDPEAKRIANANTEAVRRLTAGVAELGTQILSYTGSLVDDVRSATDALVQRLRDDLSGVLLGGTEAFEQELARLGLTFQDAQRVARGLGIELDGSVDSILALQAALRADFIRQAFESFNGQLDLTRAKLNALDAGPAERFQAILDLISEATGGQLQADLGTVNIANAPNVIAALLEKLPTFDASDFGYLSPQALIQLLAELAGLSRAAQGAADALNQATQILNAPSGFKIALQRFNATQADQLVYGVQPPGTQGGVTVEGDLVIQTQDPDRMGEQVNRKARRDAARGGTTQFNLYTNGVRN